MGERLRTAAGKPVEHKVRSVRARCLLHGSCRYEHAASSPRRWSPFERDLLDAGEALVRVRRLELAERSHLRRRSEQARLESAQRTKLLGSRQVAEALEQPLDEVDLRLRERCVDPDTTRWDSMPRRGLDDVAARCPRQVRVVENDVAACRTTAARRARPRCLARCLRARRGSDGRSRGRRVPRQRCSFRLRECPSRGRCRRRRRAGERSASV